jgi:pimeloyl-ACP methyl ester carboxylesterase
MTEIQTTSFGVVPSKASGASGARRQLLRGLPVQERRIDAAGIPTTLLGGGEGPPVVMLHGPGECGVNWRWTIPDLVSTHRVIAPDLPAHGESGTPQAGLDADRVLAWLGDLIAKACASPPVVVGHVLGGAIALRLAIRHSGRLERLVLVDSLGLARFRPSISFALSMLWFQLRPSERSYERFMRQCAYDLDGLRQGMGPLWDPFVAYNLELARGPNAKLVGQLLRAVGLPRIPADDLARIDLVGHP